MGGAACKIIIDGQFAYAVAEKAAEKYGINTALLESAIEASCEGISFAALYNLQEDAEELPYELTRKIIQAHSTIIANLLNVGKGEAQSIANALAYDLFTATKELYSDYTEFPMDFWKLASELEAKK